MLVKSWQTERAARQLAECLAPGGLALTLQNGMGNREALANALGGFDPEFTPAYGRGNNPRSGEGIRPSQRGVFDEYCLIGAHGESLADALHP